MCLPVVPVLLGALVLAGKHEVVVARAFPLADAEGGLLPVQAVGRFRIAVEIGPAGRPMLIPHSPAPVFTKDGTEQVRSCAFPIVVLAEQGVSRMLSHRVEHGLEPLACLDDTSFLEEQPPPRALGRPCRAFQIGLAPQAGHRQQTRRHKTGNVKQFHQAFSSAHVGASVTDCYALARKCLPCYNFLQDSAIPDFGFEGRP